MSGLLLNHNSLVLQLEATREQLAAALADEAEVKSGIEAEKHRREREAAQPTFCREAPGLSCGTHSKR